MSGELLRLAGEGAEVALDLQAMPELGRLAKEGTEADGHGGGDRALAEHDFVDRAWRHTDGPGHGILGNAHRRQVLLEQDFPGCDRLGHGYNG